MLVLYLYLKRSKEIPIPKRLGAVKSEKGFLLPLYFSFWVEGFLLPRVVCRRRTGTKKN